MATPFEPDALTLPRLKALDAVALATQIATAAQTQTALPQLPALIAASVASVTALRDALKAEIGDGPPAGTPTKAEADDVEDDGIRAVDAILAGWEILAKHGLAEGQTAASLRAKLFADGIKFISARYEAEWAVVEGKLDTIDKDGLDPQLASLGMTPALTFLRNAHKVYGAVLGTTAPLPERPEVGAAKQALMDAIRLFAVRVVAQVEPAKPETKALADALLLPLEEWKAKAKPKKKPAKPGPSGPQPPDAGATGPAGATGATGP